MIRRKTTGPWRAQRRRGVTDSGGPPRRSPARAAEMKNGADMKTCASDHRQRGEGDRQAEEGEGTGRPRPVRPNASSSGSRPPSGEAPSGGPPALRPAACRGSLGRRAVGHGKAERHHGHRGGGAGDRLSRSDSMTSIGSPMRASRSPAGHGVASASQRQAEQYEEAPQRGRRAPAGAGSRRAIRARRAKRPSPNAPPQVSAHTAGATPGPRDRERGSTNARPPPAPSRPKHDERIVGDDVLGPGMWSTRRSPRDRSR